QALPHMRFVIGDGSVAFILSRLATLDYSVLFETLKLSQDDEEIKSCVPLMIGGGTPDVPMALTYDAPGTGVNTGA
ncbi:malate:quinone oxidoreductase, partial [Staphylococcus aureus]